MEIRLHGSARTTPRIAKNFSQRPAPIDPWPKLYAKAVVKWCLRTSVLNKSMGPRSSTSQHLFQDQEHLAIALRKHGHLSLDDLMGQLLETAPKLSRSALH